VGARSEDRIIEFIQQQRNPTEFAYFETRYQSESWFVVVLGDYRDRQAALRAIDRLPPEIRRENPWARSIQSVQESIAQQRDGR
jgi:septal ring-binding cell division protein DamX